MALENENCVYINRAGTTIPVYSKLVKSQIHVGGHTAGGTQIGKIYPNEFYTLIKNSSHYVTNFKIIFRNSNGQQATGYIETRQADTYPYYSWVQYQEPYHFYNSNGSTLVKTTETQIGTSKYRIFTVNKLIDLKRKNGTTLCTLAPGVKLATSCSYVDPDFPGYMHVDKQKVGNSWVNIDAGSYGYVELGYSIGTMPSDRALR